jgi:hypothetical protein
LLICASLLTIAACGAQPVKVETASPGGTAQYEPSTKPPDDEPGENPRKSREQLLEEKQRYMATHSAPTETIAPPVLGVIHEGSRAPVTSWAFLAENSWNGRAPTTDPGLFYRVYAGSEGRSGNLEQGELWIMTADLKTTNTYSDAYYKSPEATGALSITEVSDSGVMSLTSAQGREYTFDLGTMQFTQ